MFKSEYGIPAPLKKWWQQLININAAINGGSDGFGACDNMRLTYGKKMYYLGGTTASTAASTYDRPATNSYLGVSYTSMTTYQLNGSYSNNFGAQNWVNLPDTQYKTLDPNRSPVIYVNAKKLNEYYGDISNMRYSDLYSGIFSRAASDRPADKYNMSISGISFNYIPELGGNPVYKNVKNLSDIGDKYIITSFDTFVLPEDTLELPRKSENYSPCFLWDCTSIMGNARSINNWKTVAPIAFDGLFKTGFFYNAWDNNRLQQRSRFGKRPFNTAVLDDGDTMHGHRIITGFNMLSQGEVTTNPWFVSNRVKSVYSIFNSHAIVIHKKNNGDEATSGEVTAADRGLVYTYDTTTQILPASGLGNAAIVFDSLDDIREMFEDLGCVVTFSMDEAQYFPVENIGDSETPPAGFPTNPTPNIDSFPDNKTDDFTLPTTINPANVACDSKIFNSNSAINLFRWFTQETFLNDFSKLFNDPLSAIISLRSYPFDIVNHDPAHVIAQSATTIVNVTNNAIGGYAFDYDYNTIVSGGSIDYTAYYGNFADWANTKYSVYIPYVGIVDMPPSAVVNRRLSLFYNVDFLTGNAVVTLKTYNPEINTNGYNNGQVVYTTTAKITTEIPIVYSNYNEQMMYNAISAYRAIQGISGGAQSGAMAGAKTGNIGAAVAGGVLGGIGSAVDSGVKYLSNFPQTEIGAKGAVSECGALAPQNAYLIINRRVLAIPANGYGNISGNPSSFYGTIGGTSGFVQATAIKCDGIPATISEISEIMSLLSAGIYV